MRYSSQHKRRTRQRIVESAYRLFAAKGFEATSIEEIMRECNLTRGGFYAHFKSKSQLYHDAINCAASQGRLSGADDGDGSIESLLSEYFDLKFLATDVASEEPEVRAAYTNAFRSMSDRILSRDASCSASSEGSILSTTAMIIGALAVAQTTDDPDFRAKLLASCKESAKALLENRTAHATPSFFWAPTAD